LRTATALPADERAAGGDARCCATTGPCCERTAISGRHTCPFQRVYYTTCRDVYGIFHQDCAGTRRGRNSCALLPLPARFAVPAVPACGHYLALRYHLHLRATRCCLRTLFANSACLRILLLAARCHAFCRVCLSYAFFLCHLPVRVFVRFAPFNPAAYLSPFIPTLPSFDRLAVGTRQLQRWRRFYALLAWTV